MSNAIDSLARGLSPSLAQSASRALSQLGTDSAVTSMPLGLGDDAGAAVGAGSAAVGENSFGDTLTRMLNGVSDAGAASADLTQRFARGENVELHQVMAAGEEAGIALDLLIELRNKAVEAYRSIISMQS